MTTTATPLPLTTHTAPAEQAVVADAIREAADVMQAVYPLGGGTSMDYGLPPPREGLGLDLTGLNRVVDYAARDMTITVETGIRMAELARTLATENQQLPLDVPRADAATLGGVIATNFSGPRRYGHGTLRDYVIGITAVDGRGVTFHGGGRVVKNVAGYDFCKLLIGSLGTLAVVTQVTLKVKPARSGRRWLVCRLTDWDAAERLLEGLVTTATTPMAIELMAGAAWSSAAGSASLPEGRFTLAVLFEGTPTEVDWQIDALHREWERLEIAGRNTAAVNGTAADELLYVLSEFPDAGPAGGGKSPLVVKVAVRPSHVTHIARLVLEIDPEATLQFHAGNGTGIVHFKTFNAADLTRVLVGRLQAAAVREGGSLNVLRSTFEALTPQIVWGGRQASFGLMESVKRQFDPHNVLNPGRFIFH